MFFFAHICWLYCEGVQPAATTTCNKRYLWCGTVKGKTAGRQAGRQRDTHRQPVASTDFILPATRSSFASYLQPALQYKYPTEGGVKERERLRVRARAIEQDGSLFRMDACMHMSLPLPRLLLLILIILIILKGKYQVSLQLALIYGNAIYHTHACTHTHTPRPVAAVIALPWQWYEPCEKQRHASKYFLYAVAWREREGLKETTQQHCRNFPQIFIIEPLQMICMHWAYL